MPPHPFRMLPVSPAETPSADAAPAVAPEDTAALPNRRLLLIERPVGAPGLQHFQLDRTAIPQPADGEVLLRTEFLSLDPSLRTRMNGNPGALASVELGAVMAGDALSRVVESRHPAFAVGDRVVADSGWQDWSVLDASRLRRVDPALPQPTLALSALGSAGFAAWLGLTDIGQPQPGETVVVAAATGAVGSVVGQLAKRLGCRVVGIAGGEEKCRLAVEQLGFDACVSHHEDDLAERLADACADGIDVYFESAGGAAFEAVLPLLNDFARIPLCGQVAWANATSLPAGYDLTPRVMRVLLNRRVRLQGFQIGDHVDARFDAFLAEMTPRVIAGDIRIVEDILDNLEHAPGALSGLLSGYNLGKLLVRVSDA